MPSKIVEFFAALQISKEEISTFICTIMIAVGFLDPLIEYMNNKPKDD